MKKALILQQVKENCMHVPAYRLLPFLSKMSVSNMTVVSYPLRKIHLKVTKF